MNITKMLKDLRPFCKKNPTEYSNFIILFGDKIYTGTEKRFVSLTTVEDRNLGLHVFTLEKPKTEIVKDTKTTYKFVKSQETSEISYEDLQPFTDHLSRFKFADNFEFPFMEFDVLFFQKYFSTARKVLNQSNIVEFIIDDTNLTLSQSIKDQFVGKMSHFGEDWDSEKPISCYLKIDINDMVDIFNLAKKYKEETIKFYYLPKRKMFQVEANTFKVLFCVNEVIEAPEVWDFEDQPELSELED